MIGLDTNVLVRYLTEDDPVQSPRAIEIIEGELSERTPGFVGLVALVETVWVLRRAYGYSRTDVAAEIERLLQIDALVVAHENSVFMAMNELRYGTGDFADALLGAVNAEAGCVHTLSFDRRAQRLPGFEPA
jgi:predicted nucleic-acid-binding protein